MLGGAYLTKSARSRRLQQQLWSRLDAEPLEDGVTHSAEEVVAKALVEPGGLAAFTQFFEAEPNPEFAASMLRLAGRVGLPADRDTRGELVGIALNSTSIALREAAVEAIEQWEDVKLMPLLAAHTEPAAWLKTYIEDVIADLCK